MNDAAERFRAGLSEQLRAALTDRDRERIHTLRCIMAALDNATAVPQQKEDGTTTPSPTEVPRRYLGEQEIAEILRTEIEARSSAADEYERVGNPLQAARLRDEITTIQHLATLPGAAPAGSGD